MMRADWLVLCSCRSVACVFAVPLSLAVSVTTDEHCVSRYVCDVSLPKRSCAIGVKN